MFRWTKRELAIGFGLGCLIELFVWFLTYADFGPQRYTGFKRLLMFVCGAADLSRVPEWAFRLQKPALPVAYFVAWHILQPPRYPWSAYIGSACGFAVLIAMWSTVSIVLMRLGFLVRRRRRSKA